MHKKICEYCNNEFETHNKKKRFCSRVCGNKHMWNNDEYRKKMSDLKKSQWANDKWAKKTKAKISTRINEMWTDDEYRIKTITENRKRFSDEEYLQKMRDIWTKEKRTAMSHRIKELWSDPQFVIKMLQTFDDTRRKKISENTINLWKDNNFRNAMTKMHSERWKNEEYQNFMSNISKQLWESNEYRKKIQNAVKEMWADDKKREEIISNMKSSWTNERRYMFSNMCIERWKDEKYADKFFKSSVKYKEFELPSGRIVKLQGYEPQVLEQLLQIYPENDIVCEVKSINKEIGKILYQYEGKERRYYPDFYIKSTNTIIEVKSQWTFDKWKDKNVAKQKACIEQGFNFEFVIL